MRQPGIERLLRRKRQRTVRLSAGFDEMLDKLSSSARHCWCGPVRERSLELVDVHREQTGALRAEHVFLETIADEQDMSWLQVEFSTHLLIDLDLRFRLAEPEGQNQRVRHTR